VSERFAGELERHSGEQCHGGGGPEVGRDPSRRELGERMGAHGVGLAAVVAAGVAARHRDASGRPAARSITTTPPSQNTTIASEAG
jgi:hypothetical protein